MRERSTPRTRVHPGRSLLAATACLLAGGCTLTTFDRTPCQSNADCNAFADTGESVCGGEGYCVAPDSACTQTAECRSRLGFGSTCNKGTCEDVEPIARCADRAFPDDLFENLASHRDRLVFGMLMDHGVETHRKREDAVELAASQINAKRGIEGQLIGVVFCDVQGEGAEYSDALTRTDAAVADARWLVDTVQVPAVIGPASSGDTTAVYTEVIKAARGRTVQITPSGTSPALTELDPPNATDEKPGLLWRSAPSATQQGELIAMHMSTREDVKIDNVAIIHEQASFGVGVAEAFDRTWRNLFGGNLKLFGYTAGDNEELRKRISQVGSSLGDYQALFILGQVDEMTLFMTEATANDDYPDDIPLYFGDTGVNAEIFTGTEDDRLFDNVLAATAALPDNFAFKKFSDEFMDHYGSDPQDATFTANAYDAMWLMALGAAWATFNGDTPTAEEGRYEVDGTNIARGLRKMVGGKTGIGFIDTDWASGVAQFMAGQAIDVTGASGAHEFDLSSEEAPGPTALYQYRNGDFEQVLISE